MITLNQLAGLSSATLLSDLDKKQIRDLQKGLSCLAYPISRIDGLYGPNTRNAWGEFKTDILSGNPLIVEPASIGKMQGKLDTVKGVSEFDVSTKKKTRKAIAAMCRELGIGLKTQIAYVLATAKWETNHTFEPVREAYWLSETWRRNNLHYYPYYGRGYVQLTWRRNYKAYTRMLGQDLVANPDLAMNSKIALFVLVHGFKTGTFTTRKIEEYINEDRTDFIGVRRCINDSDRVHEIKQLAEGFLSDM